jgi:alginate O-acetyltransferase complex protein AlgI
MVFSNLVFLFLFLPVTLLLYYISPRVLKNVVLLIASLVFYAWGEPKYILVMLFSIFMNYLFGVAIAQANGTGWKKAAITLAIVFNLGLLGFFKYSDLLIQLVNEALGTKIVYLHLDLPIGISFFTFHAMSYIIDVYRNQAKVQRSIFDLSLYITLFPQLVAGPIIRYNTLENPLHNRTHSVDKFAEGIRRFLIGLAKKVLIANEMGKVADYVFGLQADHLTTSLAWLGIIAYTLQIYFDFSGYSDMAIGLGKMFGFDFDENFNYPYISRTVSEFWRRWHISLGLWFRDYVYIPLGGNRVSKWRLYINLLIVWSLTGFWHGASWTFLAWGLYFGIWIVLERLFLADFLERLPRVVSHVYLLVIVMFGWVFFRADNFDFASQYIHALVGFGADGYGPGYALFELSNVIHIFIIAIIGATPILPYLNRVLGRKWPAWNTSSVFALGRISVLMVLFMLVVMMLVNSTYNPFIYFRF